MLRWLHPLISRLRAKPRRLSTVWAVAIFASIVLPFLTWVGLVQSTVMVVRALITLGPWLILGMALTLHIAVLWPQIKRRLYGPAFKVRPICGETLMLLQNPELLAKQRITARLAICNNSNKLLRKCSARLEGAFLLVHGFLHSSSGAYPSISNERGESFYLRWADSESAGKNRKYLDIPPDGSDHILEVLILNVSERWADFAAANPDDLESNLRGIGGREWWKLRIKIASLDGPMLDTEWVAACADRDPGPITLDYWHPRGEKILEGQRERTNKKS